jgi:type IV pilus assembly protein PilM
MGAFNIFSNRTGGSMIGLDIGTTSIKAVEVARSDKMPVVLNYGILESRGSVARSTTALQASSLKLFEEEAINLLKLLLKEMKPRTNKVAASLPVFSAFTTVLSFPAMSPKDLESAVSFKAREVIPLPISEVALDWSKVGEYEDDKGFKSTQVLLITVPHAEIRKYQAITMAAGLELASLEIEPVSLSRLLIGSDPTPSFLIDIGSRSTSITIVEKGSIKLSTQSDFAGASLTQALASSLNVNPMRAEELKKERGILTTGPNYELSTIMLPFVDAIITEVKRADFSYHSQFPAAPKIERAIISGGGANLLGIAKYIENELGMPVVKAAPFTRFTYPPEIEPLVPELNALFGVALGLASR